MESKSHAIEEEEEGGTLYTKIKIAEMISVTKGGEAVLERCPRFGSLCVSETSTTPYTDATKVL